MAESLIKTIIIIIILIIIFVVIINLICACCSKRTSWVKNIEKMTGTTTFGYANEDETYIKPAVINNFISKEQCQKLIDESQGKLIDSEVVGGKDHIVRNSKQCWIKRSDPLVKSMYDRISLAFNLPFENMEDLQIVRYEPGQYYKEHYDSCCDEHSKCNEFVNNGGHRALTILVYLNNDFTDGETYFPNLDLKIKPKPGDAIVFRTLSEDSNKCHPFALHAGLPVTSGVKYVCNIWIRKGKFY